MDLYFVGMKFNRQGAQKELNEFMMDELQGNCLLSYVNDRKEIDKRIAETNYKGKFFIDSHVESFEVLWHFQAFLQNRPLQRCRR